MSDLGAVIDVIWRVGDHAIHKLALHQRLDCRLVGTVPANEAMRPQAPDVARVATRNLGRLGHVVGIGQAARRAVELEQEVKLLGFKTHERQVQPAVVQIHQLLLQDVLQPVRLGHLVVGNS